MSLQGDLFRTNILQSIRMPMHNDDDLHALFPQGRLHAIVLSVYTDHGIVIIATMQTFQSLQISVTSLTIIYTCWHFVSSDMAPLAMASSPHSTTHLSNPGDVVTTP